jgi:hypothetical protein
MTCEAVMGAGGDAPAIAASSGCVSGIASAAASSSSISASSSCRQDISCEILVPLSFTAQLCMHRCDVTTSQNVQH